MKQTYQEFEVGFIWWSLGIAIVAGFMLGAHIAMQIGFNMNLPRALDVWIQVHGHLQIIGWAGLFIMGVSLHFLPRMTGVPIQRKITLKFILYLTAIGLLTRTNFEFWQPYVENEQISAIFKYLANIGNIVEFLGVILYVAVLIRIFVKAPDFKKKGFRIVKPFFIQFILGWVIYSTVQVSSIFSSRYEWLVWNKWSINLFVNFVLFPITFSFSILNFPLYIHLKPPKESLKHVGYFYLMIATLNEFISAPIQWEITLVNLDLIALLLDITIVVLLFLSGIIQRIFLPDKALAKSPFWRRDGIEEPDTDKKPRKGYSDYGEFGKFELLIYSAYLWLVISVFLDILARLILLLGLSVHYGVDPVRHSFLAGFISLLIIGMAQRMLPGFMHKSRIANPKIVLLTFIFGNIAVFFRVIPMLIPLYLSGPLQILTQFMLYLFGISGFIAIFSLILLLINLRKTFKMQ